MSVTILTQAQKEKAAVMFNEDGFTLTQIGTHFGVSRKTIRRVVDEVNTNLQDNSEPTPVKEVLVKVLKHPTVFTFGNDMDFNTVFTAKEYSSGVFHILGSDLLDAGGEYFKSHDKYCFFSDQVEFVEGNSTKQTELKVGDFVTINKDSEFYDWDSKSNPRDISGEVIRINEDDSVLPVWVRWVNGYQNSYKSTDLDLILRVSSVEPEVEEIAEPETEDDANYFFSATQDSISMVRVAGDAVETRNINKTSGQFAELREMLVEDTSNETLRHVFTMMDTRSVIEAFSVGRVKVDADSETVVFIKPDGTERRVPEELASDIIGTVKTYGKSRSEHLVKFLDKLMDNPSFQAIEGLYRFMKHNCIDINEDGSISAWKGVRNDLYDRHSGKIYNGNFGVEIRVDRSEVDDNVDQTCSYGLHVGAREYATNWGESLLRVKVEPQDVVAVPKDYNGQKMRTCAYTPIEVAI